MRTIAKIMMTLALVGAVGCAVAVRAPGVGVAIGAPWDYPSPYAASPGYRPRAYYGPPVAWVEPSPADFGWRHRGW